MPKTTAESCRRPAVLLTGFDAFGGHAVNPSEQVVHALRGRSIAGHRVIGAVLPTVFGECLQRLDALLDEARPALVLALGLAADRPYLSLERVAINLDDARIADNAGQQPVDRPVIDGAPPAYFCTLPVKPMAARLLRAGLPVQLSLSAGSFVCNHLLFGLLHRLANHPQLKGARGGFLHLPPAAPDGPLTLSQQVMATRLALRVALQTQDDAPRPPPRPRQRRSARTG